VRDTRRDVAACFAWKLVELRFASCLKTGGCAMTGGARDIITEIA
jgi:hypothetical protein